MMPTTSDEVSEVVVRVVGALIRTGHLSLAPELVKHVSDESSLGDALNIKPLTFAFILDEPKGTER